MNATVPPRVLVICTLLAMAVCGAAATTLAYRQSATMDEIPHLGAGYAYLRGDSRMNREHPPLVKLLAALAMPTRTPELALPRDSSTDTAWSFGHELLHGAEQTESELIGRARVPNLLLAVLLLPLVGLLMLQIGSPRAAYGSVFLAALSPLWLAHGSLVTTDTAASVFPFAVAVGAFHLLRGGVRQPVGSAAVIVICGALAMASKYSTPVTLGGVALAALADAHRLGRLRTDGRWLVGAFGLAGVLGITLTWGWPPRPEHYLDGLMQVGSNHLQGYPSYAFDRLSTEQDPLYFSRALLVKVSLGVLGICVAGLLTRAVFSTRLTHGLPALLWLPPVVHLLVFSLAAPALGVRYVLPVLPFLFCLGGLAADRLWTHRRLRSLVFVFAALHLWSFGTAMRHSPLSFFNGAFCHTGQTPPCLDDSNVDWGHALPALEAALRRRVGNTPVRVFYFGSCTPSAHVAGAIEAEPIEIVAPVRAFYAVSLHLLARSPRGAWPREAEPLEVVAGAYALFDLRSVDVLPLP